jgi:nitroreductase
VTERQNVQIGRLRPDGTRSVTVADDEGLLMRGEVGPEPGAVAEGLRISPDDGGRVVALAARAPSLHNTQPWRFRLAAGAIELYADPARHLRHIDPDGREMLISCGAALFGLRLGLRRLGYLPRVEVLPDPARPSLVGRVSAAGKARLTRYESDLLAALTLRHTHRGAFAPGDVPGRVIGGLRMDAAAEQAELAVIRQADELATLIELTQAAAAEQARDPGAAEEQRAWVHAAGHAASDGISALARPQTPDDAVGAPEHAASAELRRRLPPRDFGLPGTEPPLGNPPPVTAVLTTAADSRGDWVRAGQALHRLLLHAATRWVFAAVQSQPVESQHTRAELRSRLGLTGYPQLVLQFGRSNAALTSPRRPVSELWLADEPSD